MKTAITLSQVPEALAGPFVLRTPAAGSIRDRRRHRVRCGGAFPAGSGFRFRGRGEIPGSRARTRNRRRRHRCRDVAPRTFDHRRGRGKARGGHGLRVLDDRLRRPARSTGDPRLDAGKRRHASIYWPPASAAAPNVRQPTACRSSTNRSTATKRTSSTASATPRDFSKLHDLKNVVLLADLFHMNIEERDLAAAIREAGSHIGHVHFADSNRQAMGFGHTDPEPGHCRAAGNPIFRLSLRRDLPAARSGNRRPPDDFLHPLTALT